MWYESLPRSFPHLGRSKEPVVHCAMPEDAQRDLKLPIRVKRGLHAGPIALDASKELSPQCDADLLAEAMDLSQLLSGQDRIEPVELSQKFFPVARTACHITQLLQLRL